MPLQRNALTEKEFIIGIEIKTCGFKRPEVRHYNPTGLSTSWDICTTWPELIHRSQVIDDY